MNRILIIQTASIGDVVLATPVVENLHRAFPEAKIDILLKKGNQVLFEEHPFLHKVLIWNKSQKKYKHLFQLFFYIQKQKYDLVVNLQRFLSTGILTAFSHSKTTVGFKKNPLSFLLKKSVKHVMGEGIHEVDRNLSLIADWVKNPLRRPKLYPTKQDEAFVSRYKTVKYITISPASLWFTKQFPKERWIEFLQQVPNDLTVYLLGGKDDESLCNDIIKASSNANAVNLSGRLTLLQSTSLMQQAQMNFMNDSAPMHLCSATNAPITAIFCSTVPAFGFGPLSDNAVVVECREKLSCRPCGLHGFKSCPKQHFKCAYNININELTDF